MPSRIKPGGRFFCFAVHPNAFPFGEGGPLAVEEVLPQYGFADSLQQNRKLCRTSPAPFGGTLPKGEGFIMPDIPVQNAPPWRRRPLR